MAKKNWPKMIGAALAPFALLFALVLSLGSKTALADGDDAISPVIDEMSIRVTLAQSNVHSFFASANPVRDLFVDRTLFHQNFTPQGEWKVMGMPGIEWTYNADSESIYTVKKVDFGIRAQPNFPILSVQWDKDICAIGPMIQYVRTIREDGTVLVHVYAINTSNQALYAGIAGESAVELQPNSAFPFEFDYDASGTLVFFVKSGGVTCAAVKFRSPNDEIDPIEDICPFLIGKIPQVQFYGYVYHGADKMEAGKIVEAKLSTGEVVGCQITKEDGLLPFMPIFPDPTIDSPIRFYVDGVDFSVQPLINSWQALGSETFVELRAPAPTAVGLTLDLTISPPLIGPGEVATATLSIENGGIISANGYTQFGAWGESVMVEPFLPFIKEFVITYADLQEGTNVFTATLQTESGTQVATAPLRAAVPEPKIPLYLPMLVSHKA